MDFTSAKRLCSQFIPDGYRYMGEVLCSEDNSIVLYNRLNDCRKWSAQTPDMEYGYLDRDGKFPLAWYKVVKGKVHTIYFSPSADKLVLYKICKRAVKGATAMQERLNPPKERKENAA